MDRGTKVNPGDDDDDDKRQWKRREIIHGGMACDVNGVFESSNRSRLKDASVK